MNNIAGKTCYVIAEVGQNHNGSMKLAKQLIDTASMPIIDKAFNRELRNVNAIKFTKRDMTEELTKEAYTQIYDSPNSFGKTYGEHREMLELSYEEHEELYRYSIEKGLDFIETITSIKGLKLLEKITVSYLKIASRDLTNIPLLSEIGKTKVPVILSTGMGGLPEIDNAIQTINRYHENIVILHCISQYPADYCNLNLNSIPFLKARYKYPIGYSDHSIGIVIPVVAFSMGAEFIEKHITLSHSFKGSDHKGALEPDGLWRMTRDIRNVEFSLGTFNKIENDSIVESKRKLERSLCSNKKIKKGDLITESDLIMLSPGNGLKWVEKEKILNKRASKDIEEFCLLKDNWFE